MMITTRVKSMQCSCFLRWLVAVILNLHNFMLSTKQNITYQYELVKIRGYFYLFSEHHWQQEEKLTE